MAELGTVKVKLYAGLDGREPMEVGYFLVPLTLKSATTGTLEANIRDAIEYVQEDFKAVFTRTSDVDGAGGGGTDAE